MNEHIEPQLSLTPRLQAVADFVPTGAKFADIGTDHAYLPVHLLQTGKILSAIAADIRSGPLDRAKSTGRKYKAKNIDYRLCDGLIGIQADEVAAIAIAGMGGETIIHILSQSPWALGKTLILQPMSTQPELRQYLWEQGMTILQERTICEVDTLYSVLFIQPGQQNSPSQAELWAGRQWQGMDDPLRSQLLSHLLEKLSNALSSLAQGDSPRVVQRRQTLESLREDLIQMKLEWITWQS